MYAIEAMSLADFPEPVANHVAKHLANKMLMHRGVDAGRWEQEHAAAISEIMNWREDFEND